MLVYTCRRVCGCRHSACPCPCITTHDHHISASVIKLIFNSRNNQNIPPHQISQVPLPGCGSLHSLASSRGNVVLDPICHAITTRSRQTYLQPVHWLHTISMNVAPMSGKACIAHVYSHDAAHNHGMSTCGNNSNNFSRKNRQRCISVIRPSSGGSCSLFTCNEKLNAELGHWQSKHTVGSVWPF